MIKIQRRIFLVGAVLLLLMGLTSVAFAQSDYDLDYSYTYPDGRVRINYAPEWQIIFNQNTRAVELYFDEGSMDILPQAALEHLGVFEAGDSVQDALEGIAERINPDGETTEDFTNRDLPDDFTYTRYDYVFESEDGDEAENFILAFEADGYAVLVLAFNHFEQRLDDLEAVVYHVVSALEFDDFALNTDFSDELPTLNDSDYTDPDSVIELFEDADLIGDGELLVNEGMLSTAFSEDDPWPDTSESPNFIVSGLLSFRPAEDSRFCSAVVRIDENDDYFVAFDVMANTQFVRIREQGPRNADYRALYIALDGVDFHDPNLFTFIVRGNEATLYINNVLVVENWPLTVATVRAVTKDSEEFGGAVALHLSCVVTDYWLYTFE